MRETGDTGRSFHTTACRSLGRGIKSQDPLCPVLPCPAVGFNCHIVECIRSGVKNVLRQYEAPVTRQECMSLVMMPAQGWTRWSWRPGVILPGRPVPGLALSSRRPGTDGRLIGNERLLVSASLFQSSIFRFAKFAVCSI